MILVLCCVTTGDAYVPDTAKRRCIFCPAMHLDLPVGSVPPMPSDDCANKLIKDVQAPFGAGIEVLPISAVAEAVDFQGVARTLAIL